MRLFALLLGLVLPAAAGAQQSGQPGYYRFPAISGNAIVFTAEGDLWRVPVTGGTAQRLTTALGEETNAAISPDGKQVAFSAAYEGPTEVYVMPIDGGPPKRLTYEGSVATVVGWTPDGKVLYSTQAFATLPDAEVGWVNPTDDSHGLLPLAQAAAGGYDANGTFFFTRFPFQAELHQTLQGRHRAEHLAVREERRRSEAADQRLHRHQQGPHAVEGAHLLPQRPRRDHEPLVDGRAGP